MNCLSYSYSHGRLSNSQRQAIIKLIEKKDIDRRYIPNRRPISLINEDTKIGSKSLARRVEKVLNSVIHFNQCAYVKDTIEDRSTFDPLRSIEDIMQFTKIENVHGWLVAIDFQKAFDSVNWHFLYETLHCFRFGPSFIKWVKTFYCDITSCIMNNGYSRGYFEIERGVRQGDPLSAYLFILVTEVLAIHIRSNQNIKGISIGNVKTKLTIFADDLTVFLKDKSSYDSLALFKKCSRLMLMLTKLKHTG